MRRFVLAAVASLTLLPVAAGCSQSVGAAPSGDDAGPAPTTGEAGAGSGDGGAAPTPDATPPDAGSGTGCGSDNPIGDLQGGTACWRIGHEAIDPTMRRAQQGGFLYRSDPNVRAHYHVEVVTEADGTESGAVQPATSFEPADAGAGTDAGVSRPSTVAYLYDAKAHTLTWKHYRSDGTVFSALADQGGASDKGFFEELSATGDLDDLVLLSQARVLAGSYGVQTLGHLVIGADDLILLGIGALVGFAISYVMCEDADWTPPSGMTCAYTEWVDPSTYVPGGNCIPSGNVGSWEAYWHDGELKLCCDVGPHECKTSKGVEPCHVRCP
jgi:hypothetical protein